MQDIYYLEAETVTRGEVRGHSIQVRAHTRHGETVPPIVAERAETFLSSVVDESDLHDYASVLTGERRDYPYRSAVYTLKRNGERIVGPSWAIRPIRPNVGAL